MMSNLRDLYQKEVAPKMKEEFEINSTMAVPRLSKIVINVGMGDAKDNNEVMEKVLVNLGSLTGQKPVVTRARGSIAGFKLSKGQPIGAMVTLRSTKMYDFFEKLVTVVLPKVRDFRGIPATSFDNQGNFTLGLREQAIFPEVSFQGAQLGGKMRGLEISIINTAKNREQGKRLLELLGMPFKKEDNR